MKTYVTVESSEGQKCVRMISHAIDLDNIISSLHVHKIPCIVNGTQPIEPKVVPQRVSDYWVKDLRDRFFNKTGCLSVPDCRRTRIKDIHLTTWDGEFNRTREQCILTHLLTIANCAPQYDLKIHDNIDAHIIPYKFQEVRYDTYDKHHSVLPQEVAKQINSFYHTKLDCDELDIIPIWHPLHKLWNRMFTKKQVVQLAHEFHNKDPYYGANVLHGQFFGMSIGKFNVNLMSNELLRYTPYFKDLLFTIMKNDCIMTPKQYKVLLQKYFEYERRPLFE